MRLNIGPTPCHVFDVGGTRNERKKWIHAFESVSTIIFTVDLGAYDEVLLEEPSQNRMLEALEVFDSVCNSPWFEKTQFILFLHKVDKLERKLAKSPLTKYFPDYIGDPTDLEQVKMYFHDRFLDMFRVFKQEVTVRFTSISDVRRFTALALASVSQQPSP
jgi:hypothetical protein